MGVAAAQCAGKGKGGEERGVGGREGRGEEGRGAVERGGDGRRVGIDRWHLKY